MGPVEDSYGVVQIRFMGAVGGAELQIIMVPFAVSIKPKPRPTRAIFQVDANVTSGASSDGENEFGREIVKDVGDNEHQSQ